MGMLVNDVTALVASLAKVCQPLLRGGWGLASWAALGQRGAQLLSTPLCCPPQSLAVAPFFFQVESFIHCFLQSFSKQARGFFYHAFSVIQGAWKQNYGQGQ